MVHRGATFQDNNKSLKWLRCDGQFDGTMTESVMVVSVTVTEVMLG